MDDLSRAFYELRFRDQFVTAEGDRFQELFVSIMERAHPSDFARVQPWGNIGDLKCDGYLKSQQMVFGCYGPKEFEINRTTRKVTDDHAGAIKHWKPLGMTAWTFVHNCRHGLPPWLLQLFTTLERKDPAIAVTHWGHVEIWRKTRALDHSDLIMLFGAVPSSRDVLALRQEDLMRVIPAVAGALAMETPPTDVRPVPPAKIEFNKLSEASRLLLTHGMQMSQRVRMFFDRYEVGIGDKISAGFRNRYSTLRAGDYNPDEILWKLYEYAGGREAEHPWQMTAALAVLAFLFESCDIFERPPDTAVSA